MVVAVAGGPPRRDAVDQLAAVGEHDAAALGARDRAAAAARSSSARRAARHDRGRPRTSRLPIHSGLRYASLVANMPSLDEFARQKLDGAGAGAPAPHARPDRPARRALGGAQRPAAAVVLLQRLPRPDPASGAESRGHRRDRTLWRRRRRLAARDRRPSALRRTGSAAGAAQGDRSRLRVRLGLSRQHRHRPGAGRRAATWS